MIKQIRIKLVGYNMGLMIFLRKDKQTSYFRDALLRITNIPEATKLVLCSGYFSETNNYSIAYELLRDTQIRRLEVMAIGGMFQYSDQSFRDFIGRLRDGGTRVNSFRAKNRRWHAKVAIVLDQNVPLAGIIGSSNLTRPAFGVGTIPIFNHEADVLIWSHHVQDSYFDSLRRFNSEDSFSPIDAILRPNQPNERVRLNAIYREIMDSKLEEFRV